MQISLTSHGDWGLSWVAAEPAFMERGSHALADGSGGVWLVDPVDGEGLEEALATLGEVRGVVQLMDRHPRDARALARRHRVTHHLLPHEPLPGLAADVLVIRDRPWWREVALWLPGPRALVVPESVGTVGYFRAGDGRIGIHPMARLGPPKRLADLAPEHLLPGHGAPVSGDWVAAELSRALARSRRDIPRATLAVLRTRRRP